MSRISLILNLKKQLPSAFTSTIFSPRESSCALNSVMSAFLPSFFPCEGIEHEREKIRKSNPPALVEDPSAKFWATQVLLPRRASAACGAWPARLLSSSSEPSCCPSRGLGGRRRRRTMAKGGRAQAAQLQNSAGAWREIGHKGRGPGERSAWVGPAQVRLGYVNGLSGPGWDTVPSLIGFPWAVRSPKSEPVVYLPPAVAHGGTVSSHT